MNKLRYFLASEKGQTITGVFYSLGASVVILGALFKILHLPGAEPMLMAGMGTEAFLFAMGSLEIPHKSYDWAHVFPALKTPHGQEPPEGSAITGMPSASGQNLDVLQMLIDNGQLNIDDIKKLGDGIRKLNLTIAELGEITSTEQATKKYVTNLTSAAENMSKISDVQGQSAEEIKEITTSFVNTYKQIEQKFEHTLDTVQTNSTEAINEATQQYAKTHKAINSKFETVLSTSINESLTALNSASKELVNSYSKLTNSMEVEMKVVRENSEESQKELVNFNKNLAAINAVYEIQLNYANQQVGVMKSQIDTLSVMGREVDSIKNVFATTVSDSEAYKMETTKLKNSISELNNVYGNMLSALNINA